MLNETLTEARARARHPSPTLTSTSPPCVLQSALAEVEAQEEHPWLDAHLDVDVLMSTAHTVVIGARVQLCGQVQWHDIELVVPRRLCSGDKPSLAALLKATRHGLQRLRGAGRKGRLAVMTLSAMVDGRWQALLAQGKGWGVGGAVRGVPAVAWSG